MTAAGTDVPAKLRHALSGIGHVQWFRKVAHETPLHPTVRLLKALRDERPTWSPLRSFAIELLAVEMLEKFQGSGLSSYFREALRRIADGWLTDRKLPDPMDRENDLLAGLSDVARASIAADARAALRHIENDTWSAVSPGAAAVTSGETPPAPATNLGGRTLA